MTTYTDAILTCQNASFGYDGHIVAHNLTFSIEKGDYLCIVGENGSGKSTLIKGMLRLISPLQGSLTINAEPSEPNRGAARRSARARGGEIGYLSQASAAKKDFPAGVSEIVFSGMIGRMGLRPFYSRKEKETAADIMRRLNIEDLRRRCFRELSGGQQRRVLIARALCAVLSGAGASGGAGRNAERKMLVLDEPAAGLDPLVTAELYELLQTLNKEIGIAVIMVSHDIESALKHARHVLHITPAGYFYGTQAEYRQSLHYAQLIGGKTDE
ncbi:MAG: ATP-binding cassette domain-containing protein [Treponema sp.]|jgi:zinc transport system ATP-binding protein|nr:ATP-binding cassette domain-containing protein [Treponema sp.]